MSKKKFLLVAPQSFNLYQLIIKKPEYLGYEVIHIEDHGYTFKYASWRQRIYNLVRKIFFRDKSYKDKLKIADTYKQQQSIIKKHQNIDIALVLRADFFDKRLIEAIRQKANFTLCFHFDGISRDPEILEYVHFFDRFYVFDQDDIANYPSYDLLYSPNFYFDYPGLLDDRRPVGDEYNVYYVSTYYENRSRDLIMLHQDLLSYYDNIRFVVVCNKGKEHLMPDYICDHMEVRFDHIPFAEQLQHVAHADVIIDLVIADHKGYSFRIIEGLKFEKKVITTNPKVIEAEFYHPNNYFVLQNNNFDELDIFLKTPYIPIDARVKVKYGFSEWLRVKLIDD